MFGHHLTLLLYHEDLCLPKKWTLHSFEKKRRHMILEKYKLDAVCWNGFLVAARYCQQRVMIRTTLAGNTASVEED